MIQFYAPDIESTHSLPADESGHCCRVLRKSVGDVIQVVDGKGYCYECSILVANPKCVEVEITGKHKQESYWYSQLTIAVAPTKNSDRMEWFVEKAVEMGVNRIVFLQCERSERRRYNIERLQRIAVSAMKQSLKATLPEICEMVSFKDFMQSELPEQRLMAYCGDKCERKDFSAVYKSGEDCVILIGPEGDFSPTEVDMAVKAGFIGVTFGKCRLRTETAALYGIAAVHVLDNLAENKIIEV